MNIIPRPKTMRRVCIYRKTALWRYRKTKGIHWIICKRCWRTIKAKAYTVPYDLIDTCNRVLRMERRKQAAKEA